MVLINCIKLLFKRVKLECCNKHAYNRVNTVLLEVIIPQYYFEELYRLKIASTAQHYSSMLYCTNDKRL